MDKSLGDSGKNNNYIAIAIVGKIKIIANRLANTFLKLHYIAVVAGLGCHNYTVGCNNVNFYM